MGELFVASDGGGMAGRADHRWGQAALAVREMTSGLLFRDHGTGWAGDLTYESTGSAVFRMVSLARDFDNLQMFVQLRVVSGTW